MSIYIVALTEPVDEVLERIREEYPSPKSYQYSPTLSFIVDNKITREIAVKIGIRGKESGVEPVAGASGFIIRLGDNFSYSGYTTASLWEWLREAEK